ncbi:fibroblast growth factor-binding protein 1-like [Heterodontus francisci]|uniref:fibroblast growth factor-binding protein 1-like n=1 Tax=Heterodontus francisci TaxID=7792 RepID=UPI00355AF1F5
MKFSRVAMLLLLLFITQYLLADASDDQKQKRRRKGKEQSRGGSSQDGGKGKKPETAPSVAAEGKKQRRVKGSAPKQGKFVSQDNTQCKWTLRGEETADRSLRLDCKKGLDEYWCEFTGKPSACAKYTGGAKTYWKQITRSLKKQKALCSDPSAVLKSSLCKNTKAAHLKMIRSNLQSARTLGEKQSKLTAPLTTANPDNIDVDKIAEENCNESWGSLCKFMISAFRG